MNKMPLPIVIDTREQSPFTFKDPSFDPPPFVSRATLPTGDYSVRGMENLVAVERKSLQDLAGSLGVGHDRFEREVVRAMALEFFAIVVEAPLADFQAGAFRGALNPAAGEATLDKFAVEYGAHIYFEADRAAAERRTYRLLQRSANIVRRRDAEIMKAWKEIEASA